MDNCCAELDDERRVVQNCGIQYTVGSCFSHFYGWSLAHKSAPRTFNGSHSAAVLVREREKVRAEKASRVGREVGGRSDEWIEACGTRSPTRPSGNSTRSSTYYPLSCVNAREDAAGRQAGRQASRARVRLRGKGESCFDSYGGSRLVEE